MNKQICVRLNESSEGFISKAFQIFQRIISERSDIRIVKEGKAQIYISLRIGAGIGTEGFKIADGMDGSIEIIGNDKLGLLYGIGKFLRDSSYVNRDFIPGDWRGVSVPDKEMRGVYLATHFYNYYHTAPTDEIKQYLEELVLWGNNLIGIWFDMHHYQSINDPEAVHMIERLHEIAKAAKEIGMKVQLVAVSNEAYANSPKELRAEWAGGQNGYTGEPYGHFHVELCPNKPGGMEQLLEWRKEVFKAFLDVELDYFSMAAYDQGGCTCSKCAPWGSNGYLYTFETMVELAKSYFPNIKIILVTWYFDKFVAGEWEGLGKAFKERPDWVDYILADDANGIYPKYVLENGVPGNLPLINFPEISMYGAMPWGGFGANPLPQYLQSLYNQSKKKISGGITYSEGNYEDINKAIACQLYWDGSRSALDIVKEYIGFEYSKELIEEIFKVIQAMENSYQRTITCESNEVQVPGVVKPMEYIYNKDIEVPVYKIVIENCKDINETYGMLNVIDGKLPLNIKNSWRWQVLYLRGVIDYELASNRFEVNTRCDAAFRELIKIYHAENADYVVCPPVIEGLKTLKGF